MKSFKTFCLFLSSFIPLYFLIIVKELVEILNNNLSFNVTNSTMLSLNLVFILLGIVGVCLEKKQKYFEIQVVSAKNTTSQNFFQYFPLFALFALAFELEFISMAVVYVLVLIMLGAVYIKNGLTHINPFLNIIGFSTYEISYKKGESTEKTFMFSTSQIFPGKNFSNGLFIRKKLEK